MAKFKFSLNQTVVTDTPTVEVEALPPGQHQFQLVVEDEAGNFSPSVTGAVRVAAGGGPRITGLEPSFGLANSSVIILGANFDPDINKNAVSFNGVRAAVTEASATQLKVAVPASATSGVVAVGTAVSPKPFLIPRFVQIAFKFQPADFDFDTANGDLWVVGIAAARPIGVLSIVNVEKKLVADTIQLEQPAAEIALPATGRSRACVVTSSIGKSAAVINMDTRKLAASFSFQNAPTGVALSPDGRWAYVVTPNPDAKSVVNVIDLAELKQAGTVAVTAGAERAVFSPDGSEVFLNNTKDAVLTVMDGINHKVVDEIRLNRDAAFNPLAVGLSAETYPVWTGSGGNASAHLINKSHVAKALEIGLRPTGVDVAHRSGTAYFIGTESKLIASMTSGAQSKVAAARGPGGSVKSIAATPREELVFAVHPAQNLLGAYETAALDLRAAIATAEQPMKVLVTNDGRFACAICQKGAVLTVLEIASLTP